MQWPEGPKWRGTPAAVAIAVGVGLTALQISMALAIAPGRSLTDSYSLLCQWDCVWYESISRDGYHSSIPPVRQQMQDSNVAFFPAFPFLGRALHRTLGVSHRTGLLIAAQICAVGFWSALWMLLKKWKIPFWTSVLVLLATLAHPAAFFLIAPYSESLFLSSLLFFMIASMRPASAPFLTLVLGAVLSATRLVGSPAAVFPLAHHLSRRARQGTLLSSHGPPLIASLGAVLGGIGFLAYCAIHFGRYDLYMETQRIGWGVHPDLGAILKWRQFVYYTSMDRYATLGSGLAFALMGGAETVLRRRNRRSGLGVRIPFYGVAFLLFVITLSGLKSVKFLSMIRYSLPWSVLLLLCVAHFSMRRKPLPRPLARLAFIFLVSCFLAVLLLAEIPALKTFLNGQWVA